MDTSSLYEYGITSSINGKRGESGLRVIKCDLLRVAKIDNVDTSRGCGDRNSDLSTTIRNVGYFNFDELRELFETGLTIVTQGSSLPRIACLRASDLNIESSDLFDQSIRIFQVGSSFQ